MVYILNFPLVAIFPWKSTKINDNNCQKYIHLHEHVCSLKNSSKNTSGVLLIIYYVPIVHVVHVQYHWHLKKLKVCIQLTGDR